MMEKEWIVKLGKRKQRRYATDEERLEARRERQRRYQARLREERAAAKNGEKEIRNGGGADPSKEGTKAAGGI